MAPFLVVIKFQQEVSIHHLCLSKWWVGLLFPELSLISCVLMLYLSF